MAQGIKAPYMTEREAIGKRVHEFSPNALPSKSVPGTLVCLDVFAGSGGFSTALMRASRALGFKVDLTVVNHWAVALDNARENLGNVRVFNAGIQDLDPREVIPGRHVDIMLASPECIFFSAARGAKPINEQKRSTAAEVLRFLELLNVECLVLENVSELEQWGDLDPVTKRPIKEKKGRFFKAFIKAIKRLGYSVEYRNIVAADMGDPTTRKRLFLIAQKNRAVSFPMQTHSKDGKVPGTLPWVPARAIIDFSIKGQSIFERPDPHCVKTLRRIGIGFADQVEKTPLAGAYVEAVNRFKRVAEIYYEQIEALPSKKKLGRGLTKEERLQVKSVKAAARHQHRLLVDEIFSTPVATLAWEDLLMHQSVQPTLGDNNHLTMGTMNAVSPVITKLYGTGTTSNVDQPLDTVTAGGVNFGVARPVPDNFLVTVNHGDTATETGRHASIDDPLNTITTKGSQGLVSAFCLRANASDTSAWDDAVTDLDNPLRTVTTKNNLSVILPDATILPQHTYNRDNVATPEEPLPTITTISRHGLVQAVASEPVEPFIASYYGPKNDKDRRPRSIDEPLATQPTANRFSVVEGTATPVVETGAELVIDSVDAVIIPQQRGAGVEADSVDRPLRALTTKNGTGVAMPTNTVVPDAFVTPNFGERETQKPRTHSLDSPLPTATSHGAGMLVEAELANTERGKPYIIVGNAVLMLDVLYRMLGSEELARAMSFTTDTDTYRFKKTTSTSNRVRMIGNAVAVRTAQALIAHALRHRFAELEAIAA